MNTNTSFFNLHEGLSFAAAHNMIARRGGSMRFENGRWCYVPPLEVRRAGSRRLAPAARLAQLDAELGRRPTANPERDRRVAAFLGGEVVTVRRRRRPAERMGEIDRELLWRGGIS